MTRHSGFIYRSAAYSEMCSWVDIHSFTCSLLMPIYLIILINISLGKLFRTSASTIQNVCCVPCHLHLFKFKLHSLGQSPFPTQYLGLWVLFSCLIENGESFFPHISLVHFTVICLFEERKLNRNAADLCLSRSFTSF